MTRLHEREAIAHPECCRRHSAYQKPRQGAKRCSVSRADTVLPVDGARDTVCALEAAPQAFVAPLRHDHRGMRMTTPESPETNSKTILDRLEEWIYRLNEKDHWIFRLYDLGNEIWARLVFRGVRKKAESINEEISESGGGQNSTEAGDEVHVRFLSDKDAPAFAEFCGKLSTRYLPPHPLDPASARAALKRQSYIPLGIFLNGSLEGYLLIRFFFPRRAVAGIWIFPSLHGKKYGRDAFWVSTCFLRACDLPAYCTIPIGNTPSVNTAKASGYEVLRTNSRFHVLRVDPPLFERRLADRKSKAAG